MRLTYKTDCGEYTGMPNKIKTKVALQKLATLEDIEDELKIDITVINKALKRGIYVKRDEKIINVETKDLLCDDYGIYTIIFDHFIRKAFLDECYDYEDYGKTWALTSEELL